MPGTVITRETRLFDSTAVDNTFITDLMPSAPANAVKVYLYGLMLTLTPSERTTAIEDALGLSSSEVADAFRYWEGIGAIRIAEGDNLTVQYLNLRNITHDAESSAVDVGKYADFVRILQLVLGTRYLSGNEMQRIYDWIEVFGFEDDAAIEIVRHCIELKGARVHINYMDSVAKRLAADGCLTYDAVHASFVAEMELATGAGAILKRWHSGRRPTEDELQLYEKWTRKWGFSCEAIDLACAHVVASDKPNFKYLDAILDQYHSTGSISPDSIRELNREQDLLSELARKAFAKAGLRRSVSAADRQQFAVWRKDWHMGDELILCAAELAATSTRQFATMKKLLMEWHELGIVNTDVARAHSEKPGGTLPAARPKSINRALNYRQNRYTAEQLRELGIDIGDDIYEDKITALQPRDE